jgi:energy-converting hydrogenase Eha subunit F
MDRLIDILLDSFDFGYMLATNVLTYIIIKVIDFLNKEKVVPVYLKRIIAFISGGLLSSIIIYTNGFSTTILYSFILSLISWDFVFKPIIKKFKSIDYRRE